MLAKSALTENGTILRYHRQPGYWKDEGDWKFKGWCSADTICDDSKEYCENTESKTETNRENILSKLIRTEEECKKAAEDIDMYTWAGSSSSYDVKGCFTYSEGDNKTKFIGAVGASGYKNYEILEHPKRRLTNYEVSLIKLAQNISKDTLLIKRNVYFNTEDECKNTATELDEYTWGGSGNYTTKGCYISAQKIWYGTGGEELDRYTYTDDLPTGQKRMTKFLFSNKKLVQILTNLLNKC